LCSSDRKQLYIGDDNELTLEISAENWGEGAYEAELRVFPPPQADYTTVVRSQVGHGRKVSRVQVGQGS
jgi:intercellular adhesion molecule 4